MDDVIVILSTDNLLKLKQGNIIKKIVPNPNNKLIILLGKNPPSKDEENMSNVIGWDTTYLPITDDTLALIENKEADIKFHYDDYSISIMSAKTYQKQHGEKK